LVFEVSLVRGFTSDGWQYRVYWSEHDGKFRVEFSNEWKEVWVLDDVRIEGVMEGYHIVFPSAQARAYLFNVLPEEVREKGFLVFSLREAVRYTALAIAYGLEHDGSAIIRGKRALERAVPEETAIIKVPPVSPFGRVRLVFEKAVPIVPAPEVWAREARRELVRRAPTPAPSPALPKVKEAYGLGSEGMRRLRVLFESTLYGLGIKPTAELRVRAEEVIYRLESKYKDVPRDEAIERAVNDLLKWIEENVYFT